MTAPNTTTGGILRPRPRYSTAADGDGNDGINGEDGVTDQSDGAITLPSKDNAPANNDNDNGCPKDIDDTARKVVAVATSVMSSKKRQPTSSHRSLADLANSSAQLSAEARGINADEIGKVISHSHKSNTSSRGSTNHQSNGVDFVTDGEGLSILEISETGTPYLKAPVAATNNNDNNNGKDKEKSAGPQVVMDEETMIAVGVMGEDGKQVVRFCEYDNVKNETKDDNLSSRDRLEQRIDVVQYADDNDNYDDTNEGCKIDQNEDDTDSNSSGSAQDDDILRELGLHDLVCEPNEDLEDEMEPQQLVDRNGNAEEEEMRSFRILWELLSRWATPATVNLVLHYQGKESSMQQQQPQQNEGASKNDGGKEDTLPANSSSAANRSTVDIGASRRASIMAMLKMSITRSFSELKKMHVSKSSNEMFDQRRVEARLAELVGTFDPSAPAANLNMKMWKGLTTILIAIVAFPTASFGNNNDSSGSTNNFGNDDGDRMLPPSIRTLKMSAVEYRYLTQSAIVSLSGGSHEEQ